MTHPPAPEVRAGSRRVPAVSVIVTAYNVAEYVGEALQSVFAQTFDDFEVIVVDDGSPDVVRLEQALRPFRDRITCIRQPNRGASAARNTGIRAAAAPLVAILDGDDVWEPGYLAAQVAAFERDRSLDLAFANALFFGEGSLVGRDCMSLSPVEGEMTFERVVAQQTNVIGFVVARREILLRAGLFDESLASSEDFELWARILKIGGRVGWTREVLARYRRHAGSLSSDPEAIYRTAVQVYDKFAARPDLTPRERAAVLAQRERFQADLRFTEGKKAFFRGDVATAIARMTTANAVYRSRKIAATLVLLRLAPRLLLRAYDLRDRFVYGTTTRV